MWYEEGCGFYKYGGSILRSDSVDIREGIKTDVIRIAIRGCLGILQILKYVET